MLMQASCTCSPPADSIKLDGSSTVYVISEAVAEEFQKQHQGQISIGVSGTGGGFKKLCSGRINIIGASRAIKDSEKKLCRENHIEPTEFAVAIDGIVVVVNRENTWLDSIKISTLKKIFEPAAENKIINWSDVESSWPQRKMAIFTPGISSGTYDYFTQTIVGVDHASRGDMTTSEDDNILVHGIRSNLDSIGFFSYAYYLENQDGLKALAIIDDSKPASLAVLPSKESIYDGSYRPLSRPVFIYANQGALSQSAHNFLAYYIEHSLSLATDVGFIAVSKEMHEQSMDKLRSN